MADEPEDELLLDDEAEGDELDAEQEGDAAEGEADDSEGGDEPALYIDGEEAAPASADDGDNSVIREMRRKLREANRKLAEAEGGAVSKPVDVGPKPTLAGCDYDEEKFDAEYEAWKQRNAQAERATTEQEAKKAEAAKVQAQVLQSYAEKKRALGFRDFDEAEKTVVEELEQSQQWIIAKYAADPAKVIYALGKSPARLAEIARIEDPLELAVAVAKLEGKLTVQKRKPPQPERHVSGSAPGSSGVDQKEARLMRDADRTGDRSALVAYRAARKAKAG